MKLKNVILFLITIFTFQACNPVHTPSNNETSDRKEVCLPPLFDSAFPIDWSETSYSDVVALSERSQKPVVWEAISKLGSSNSDEIELLFTRVVEEKTEIIFRAIQSSHGIVDLMSYNIHTGEQKQIISSLSYGDRIYMDPTGRIWMLKQARPTRKSYNVLILIDEKNDEMVSYLDDEKILMSEPIDKLVIGPDGDIWVMLYYGRSDDDQLLQQIYRFSPQTKKIKPYLDPGTYYTFDIDSDYNIFVWNHEGVIHRLDHRTGEINSYKLLSGGFSLGGRGSPFYFDEKERRVWLNDRVWFNNDPEFSNAHYIIRSPIFIDRSIGLFWPYEWYHPSLYANTADGRYWFSSTSGTAWFRPESGEWCLFSTADSSILKDDDGNLWMVYDDVLYMLPASETQAEDKWFFSQ